jgi:hypothetical protein
MVFLSKLAIRILRGIIRYVTNHFFDEKILQNSLKFILNEPAKHYVFIECIFLIKVYQLILKNDSLV